MNINLGGNYPQDDDGTAESFSDQLAEHQQILTNGGINVVGAPVLVPEGDGYPGSYQVWSPVESHGEYEWLYINPEGVAIIIEHLPTAWDVATA